MFALLASLPKLRAPGHEFIPPTLKQLTLSVDSVASLGDEPVNKVMLGTIRSLVQSYAGQVL